ncbi:hypothetical protein D9613_004826 [Agrocybe pediades]|uniref:BD-FAE-like domain-containing protein n=1 Tax=Agrocybe pediades TaxID=84607 RepID=A0A8H4QZU4_9AGAR|nr:hypothetical protein D9613_004826 [Agrocybe pediades]
MSSNQVKTIEYKKLDNGQPILIDVYFPPLPRNSSNVSLPVVVNFHGGALTIGNRKSFFPGWLLDRVLSMGYAFISADYRLLIPHTGEEIIEDLQDLFKFIASTIFQGEDYSFKLDNDRIAAVGDSGGAILTYLTAIHCTPKPKVLLSVYGSGGDFSDVKYLTIIEGDMVIMNRTFPHVDPAKFSKYLYPYPDGLPDTATEVPLDEGFLDDGEWSNPRINFPNLLIQQGRFLDYYTGLHNPSISDTFRNVLKKKDRTVEDIKRAIPKDKLPLFPQFCVTPHWPATVLLHGTADDAVSIEESRNMKDLLQEAKVPVKLIEIEGASHIFDLLPGAEEKYTAEFDGVKEFIQKYL